MEQGMKTQREKDTVENFSSQELRKKKDTN